MLSRLHLTTIGSLCKTIRSLPPTPAPSYNPTRMLLTGSAGMLRAELTRLPPELRHEIYGHLISGLKIKPDEFPKSDAAYQQQHVHPQLAILQTCRLIHSEACQMFSESATLVLDTPKAVKLMQSGQRLPKLEDVRHLVVDFELLSDLVITRETFSVLESLSITQIAVNVPHSSLLHLEDQRSQRETPAGNKLGPGFVDRGWGLSLVQALMGRLEPQGCDNLLAVLTAARGNWDVRLDWVIRCISKWEGELDLDGDWMVHWHDALDVNVDIKK
jgi:hypothetical protein